MRNTTLVLVPNTNLFLEQDTMKIFNFLQNHQYKVVEPGKLTLRYISYRPGSISDSKILANNREVVKIGNEYVVSFQKVKKKEKEVVEEEETETKKKKIKKSNKQKKREKTTNKKKKQKVNIENPYTWDDDYIPEN